MNPMNRIRDHFEECISMQHDFTEGNVLKKMLFFSVPIFGTLFLQALYGTIDLLIVGMYSDAAAVSAVSTGSMTIQTVTSIISFK